MANSNDRLLPNVPNFRRLEGTNLFRSSKPDWMKQADIDIARDQLQVQCIIDLRSVREVSKPRMVDQYFIPYAVKCPVAADTVGSRNVTFTPLFADGTAHTSSELPDNETKHLVFNMVSTSYVKAILKETWFLTRMFLQFLAICDKMLKTNLFFKYLVLLVINTKGLVGQYKDTIKYCGKEICAVLHTLLMPANTPAIICCAHGKDRTGIITAVVLRLLGMSKDVIAKDYSKSKDEILAAHTDLELELKKFHLNRTFATAEYDTMMELLDFIDSRYGSITDYLISVGFGKDKQQQLLSNIQMVES